jgi:hypothetical protein
MYLNVYVGCINFKSGVCHTLICAISSSSMWLQTSSSCESVVILEPAFVSVYELVSRLNYSRLAYILIVQCLIFNVSYP